ncbi:hypothetical protein [Actinoallomurus iriomotensis]|uniref:hypothetical protein n=1 Tax=Actinoallomurus iriomotensis TaxID=478107 RepID=UPI0025531A72|nr:hypothetical protein [Actinoallomurus iriomotensis]
MRSSVVLPQPLSPTTEKISPSHIVKEMSLSTWVNDGQRPLADGAEAVRDRFDGRFRRTVVPLRLDG